MELVEETCFLGGQGELVGLMDTRVGNCDPRRRHEIWLGSEAKSQEELVSGKLNVRSGPFDEVDGLVDS